MIIDPKVHCAVRHGDMEPKAYMPEPRARHETDPVENSFIESWLGPETNLIGPTPSSPQYTMYACSLEDVDSSVRHVEGTGHLSKHK